MERTKHEVTSLIIRATDLDFQTSIVTFRNNQFDALDNIRYR